jgi:hypothetical protein
MEITAQSHEHEGSIAKDHFVSSRHQSDRIRTSTSVKIVTVDTDTVRVLYSFRQLFCPSTVVISVAYDWS